MKRGFREEEMEDKGWMASHRTIGGLIKRAKTHKIGSIDYLIGLIILLFIIVAVVWTPMVHSVFGLWRALPIWILVAIFGYGFYRARKIWLNADSRLDVAKAGCVLVVFLIPLLAYLFFMGPLVNNAIVNSVDSTELSILPQASDVRFIPLDVAEAVASSTMADSRYNAGDIDPFDYKGQLSYSVPRVPNGWWNWLFEKTNGIMLIEANLTEKKPDTRIVAQEFNCGEGMALWNNIEYALYKKHFWCEVPEIYYAFLGDELVAIAPYLDYRFEVPVWVPYWGGVFVVHGNGSVEQLIPQEALSDPRLAGQRLFPETMARKIADGWQYKNGFLNAFTSHIDMAIVDDPTESDNPMPYLVPTSQGDVWIVAYKPYGNTDAIYKIQMIDARTGKVMTYNVRGLNWIGPNKAMSLMPTLHQSWDWSSIHAVEAKPVPLNGRLSWQISLVNTKSNLALMETAFVDAETQDIIPFQLYKDIKDYIQTGAYKLSDTAVADQRNSIIDKVDLTDSSMNLSQMSVYQLTDLIREASSEIDRKTLH